LLNTENGDISTTMNQQQISESPEPRKRSDVHSADCSGCDHEHRRLLQRQFFDLGDARHLKSFTINGMGFNDTSTNVNMSGAMNLTLGQNQIQEATIVSNGYSGRLGGAAGANINYITKSGATTFTAAFVNGFAAGQTLAQIQEADPFFVPPGISVADNKTHSPQYQKWSLQRQQAFGANTSLSIGYSGYHGIHESVLKNSLTGPTLLEMSGSAWSYHAGRLGEKSFSV